MAEENIRAEIDAINKKLDLICEEIGYQRRRRLEMDDLKEDALRVGKDLFQTTVQELEEVHDHIKTGDMLYLFKKLLRNINNITKTFEQLENLKDFLQDFAPVSRDMFLDFMNKLNEFDKKGYFEFAREISKISDKVVTSFTPEDMKNLGENSTEVINTMKNITSPEVLRTVNNAANALKNIESAGNEKISIFSLMKELGDPEVKRGLAFAVRFLKNFGKTNQGGT